MNAYLPLNGIELWFIAGWTMVHFLWLGALVGGAAAVGRLLLRRASANSRYAFMLASLIALATLPVGIAAWLYHNSSLPNLTAHTSTVRGPVVDQISDPVIELSGRDVDATDKQPPAPGSAGRIVVDTNHGSPSETPRQSRGLSVSVPEATLTTTFDRIESCIPYLPWLWIIGTPVTLALLLTGVVGTKRLGRASRPIVDGPIAELLARLIASLRITRRVTVAICDRIAAPVLIGIVRPMILLPPAALTGWSPDEIEMVLLHELAHVRRWDNLINLMQRIVESLLFFHPAVWLISTWVRREREACCDAAVVARTARPHAYAELLVALAAQMPRNVLFHSVASSAMAAGPLRSRIRRILQLEDDPMLVSGKSFALMLGSFFVAATLAVLYVPTIGQADQSTTEATETDAAKHESQKKQTQDNLKNISLALQNYNQSHRTLPAHAMYSANNKPLLSWRVLILPFLDQESLYREFHLDEPWDSDHNRKLIARMPVVFQNPKLSDSGKTNYLAVVGKECVFNGTLKGLGFTNVSDGTSNTIAVVEADADQAVEWTKPQDWNFDRQHPTKGLGSLWPDGWHAAWVDASVRRIANSEPADVVGIQFTRAGRETRSLQESTNRAVPEGAGSADPATPHAAGPESELEPVLIPLKFVLNRDESGRVRLYMNDQPVADDVVRTTILGQGRFIGKLQVSLSAENGIDSAEVKKVADLLKSLGVKKLTLAARAEPTQSSDEPRASDDWPAGYDFATPRDAEISAAMWRRLYLKLVPATPAELKAAGASHGVRVLNAFPDQLVPNGKKPLILTKVNDVLLRSFDDILKVHEDLNGSPQHFVTCTVVFDGTTIELKRERNEAVQPTAAGKPVDLPRATENASAGIGSHKFPSLEDQKLADLAWKRLGLELEPIGAEDLKRVKALGYDGGVKVAVFGGSVHRQGAMAANDILVGLHAWPTTSLKDVAEILNRDDLAELNPLKYYAVRQSAELTPTAPPKTRDTVQTGRITVQLDGDGPFGRSDPARTRSKPTRSTPEMGPYQAAPSMPTSNAAADDLFGSTDIKPRPLVAEIATPSVKSPALLISPSPYSVPVPPVGTSTDAPSDKSNLRYDGKSFDEWRRVWKTELSTEKRGEAVKALAAFGRAGYGKEATQAILDVAGEYDFSVIEGKTSEGQLKQLVLDELAPRGRTQILAPYWVPELTTRLKKEASKWKLLTIGLFTRLQTDDQPALKILHTLAQSEDSGIRAAVLGALVRSTKLQPAGADDDPTRTLIAEALRSKDPRVVLSVLNPLEYPARVVDGAAPLQPKTNLIDWPATLPALLFNPDKGVRRQARFILQRLDEKYSQPIFDQLLVALNDKSREPDHIEAIRAIGAVGPRGESAIALLEKILGDQAKDLSLRVAAGFAIDRIESGTRGRNLLAKQADNAADERTQARRIRLSNEEQQIQQQ